MHKNVSDLVELSGKIHKSKIQILMFLHIKRKKFGLEDVAAALDGFSERELDNHNISGVLFMGKQQLIDGPKIGNIELEVRSIVIFHFGLCMFKFAFIHVLLFAYVHFPFITLNSLNNIFTFPISKVSVKNSPNTKHITKIYLLRKMRGIKDTILIWRMIEFLLILLYLYFYHVGIEQHFQIHEPMWMEMMDERVIVDYILLFLLICHDFFLDPFYRVIE
ncbi:hypothetical protein ACJX0J_009198, partial [Zea mays]